jgi:hypothetical protein
MKNKRKTRENSTMEKCVESIGKHRSFSSSEQEEKSILNES